MAGTQRRQRWALRSAYRWRRAGAWGPLSFCDEVPLFGGNQPHATDFRCCTQLATATRCPVCTHCSRTTKSAIGTSCFIPRKSERNSHCPPPQHREISVAKLTPIDFETRELFGAIWVRVRIKCSARGCPVSGDIERPNRSAYCTVLHAGQTRARCLSHHRLTALAVDQAGAGFGLILVLVGHAVSSGELSCAAGNSDAETSQPNRVH